MPTPKRIHASELKNLPRTQFLKNTHLAAGGLNILFGPSGAYKSFYALHQSLMLAQEGSVLYIAGEGVPGIYDRLEACCEHYKIGLGGLWFICEEINLLDPASVDEFIKARKKEGDQPQLIVFDTYARCMIDGDENSARDTGKMIRHCAHIQRQLKTAVLLIHHTNVGGARERGSSALRGAADVMIEMTNDDGLIQVKCSKPKDSAPWATEKYRFHPVNGSGILLPTDEARAQTLTQKEIEVLEFLSLEVFEGCGARGSQIEKALNISAPTLYRLLSRLESNSHVTHERRGDPYKVTEIGRLTLSHLTGKIKQLDKLFNDNEIEIQVS